MSEQLRPIEMVEIEKIPKETKYGQCLTANGRGDLYMCGATGGLFITFLLVGIPFAAVLGSFVPLFVASALGGFAGVLMIKSYIKEVLAGKKEKDTYLLARAIVALNRQTRIYNARIEMDSTDAEKETLAEYGKKLRAKRALLNLMSENLKIEGHILLDCGTELISYKLELLGIANPADLLSELRVAQENEDNYMEALPAPSLPVKT